MFVIRRNSDKKYVARHIASSSYTSKLEEARTFRNEAHAREFGVCGDETVIPIESLLGG